MIKNGPGPLVNQFLEPLPLTTRFRFFPIRLFLLDKVNTNNKMAYLWLQSLVQTGKANWLSGLSPTGGRPKFYSLHLWYRLRRCIAWTPANLSGWSGLNLLWQEISAWTRGVINDDSLSNPSCKVTYEGAYLSLYYANELVNEWPIHWPTDGLTDWCVIWL